MTRESSPLRKYLLGTNENATIDKVTLRSILNETCQDFQEQDDAVKVDILKDILLLLIDLVFDGNPVHIESSPNMING